MSIPTRAFIIHKKREKMKMRKRKTKNEEKNQNKYIQKTECGMWNVCFDEQWDVGWIQKKNE